MGLALKALPKKAREPRPLKRRKFTRDDRILRIERQRRLRPSQVFEGGRFAMSQRDRRSYLLEEINLAEVHFKTPIKTPNYYYVTFAKAVIWANSQRAIRLGWNILEALWLNYLELGQESDLQWLRQHRRMKSISFIGDGISRTSLDGRVECGIACLVAGEEDWYIDFERLDYYVFEDDRFPFLPE